MTITEDAAKLVDYLDSLGLDGASQVSRGWDHIGAVVVDAALQRRQKYEGTVKPRVMQLIETWPDAHTVSGFRRRMDSGELSNVIRWKSRARLTQIVDITSVLECQSIETVNEFRDRLVDPSLRSTLRAALRAVRNVGPKTLDYFDILAGIPTGVAIDSRIRAATSAAGIKNTSYTYLAAVIREAAKTQGWRAGDLDAALWKK